MSQEKCYTYYWLLEAIFKNRDLRVESEHNEKLNRRLTCSAISFKALISSEKKLNSEQKKELWQLDSGTLPGGLCKNFTVTYIFNVKTFHYTWGGIASQQLIDYKRINTVSFNLRD